MVNIGWYSMGYYLDLFFHIANYLSGTNEYKISHVIQARWEEKKLLGKYNFNGNVYNLNQYLKNNWNNFDITPKALKKIENDYKEFYPRLFMLADHNMYRKTFYELLKYLVGHIKFYEEYIEKEQLHFLVGERCSMITTSAAWAASNKMGIRYLNYVPIGIDCNFYISTNRMGFPDYLLERYNYFKKYGLSEEQKDKSKSYINSFLNKPTKYTDVIYWGKKFKITSQMVRLFFESVRDYYADTPYYIYESPFQRAKRNIERIIRANLYNYFNIFERPLQGEKYVLYPLVSENEACFHVIAPFNYTRQMDVIYNLAMSLPLDVVLYVKEHTSMIGHRRIGFLRKLKEIPNVRLIGPYENSFELIKNSSVIALLYGTMGWEAILYDKPVLLIGNAWYDCYEGVVNCGDPKYMHKFIYEALKMKVSSGNKEAFVASVLEECKKGYVWHFDPAIVFGQENIKCLGDALIEKIGAINENKSCSI